MGPQATSVWGLKLLVYLRDEAGRWWCAREGCGARLCRFLASVYLSVLALLVHLFTTGSAHAKDAARACVAGRYDALSY